MLPLKGEPEDFFLLIRDPRRELLGGIHIKSPEIVAHVKSIYDETIKGAKAVTPENVDEMIVKLKARVDSIYNSIKARK